MSLKKSPSISETLDWAAALVSLCVEDLTDEILDETLSVVLKYELDLSRARGKMSDLKRALV